MVDRNAYSLVRLNIKFANHPYHHLYIVVSVIGAKGKNASALLEEPINAERRDPTAQAVQGQNRRYACGLGSLEAAAATLRGGRRAPKNAHPGSNAAFSNGLPRQRRQARGLEAIALHQSEGSVCYRFTFGKSC